MNGEFFRQLLDGILRDGHADHDPGESAETSAPWHVIESARLKRFHAKIIRKRDDNVAARREACEREQGWFTTKGAKAHYPGLGAIPVNQLSSLLNRTRRLMRQPIRRMPNIDGTLGPVTYNLIVVEAVASEIKMLGAKSKNKGFNFDNDSQQDSDDA